MNNNQNIIPIQLVDKYFDIIEKYYDKEQNIYQQHRFLAKPIFGKESDVPYDEAGDAIEKVLSNYNIEVNDNDIDLMSKYFINKKMQNEIFNYNSESDTLIISENNFKEYLKNNGYELLDSNIYPITEENDTIKRYNLNFSLFENNLNEQKNTTSMQNEIENMQGVNVVYLNENSGTIQFENGMFVTIK